MMNEIDISGFGSDFLSTLENINLFFQGIDEVMAGIKAFIQNLPWFLEWGLYFGVVAFFIFIIVKAVIS